MNLEDLIINSIFTLFNVLVTFMASIIIAVYFNNPDKVKKVIKSIRPFLKLFPKFKHFIISLVILPMVYMCLLNTTNVLFFTVLGVAGFIFAIILTAEGYSSKASDRIDDDS
jgi:hypothetical protein